MVGNCFTPSGFRSGFFSCVRAFVCACVRVLGLVLGCSWRVCVFVAWFACPLAFVRLSGLFLALFAFVPVRLRFVPCPGRLWSRLLRLLPGFGTVCAASLGFVCLGRGRGRKHPPKLERFERVRLYSVLIPDKVSGNGDPVHLLKISNQGEQVAPGVDFGVVAVGDGGLVVGGVVCPKQEDTRRAAFVALSAFHVIYISFGWFGVLV